MTTIKTTQATMTFNYDVDGESCEVQATWFLGRVTINGVRRNAGYKFVSLTDAQRKDLANVARWYFRDEIK